MAGPENDQLMQICFFCRSFLGSKFGTILWGGWPEFGIILLSKISIRVRHCLSLSSFSSGLYFLFFFNIFLIVTNGALSLCQCNKWEWSLLVYLSSVLLPPNTFCPAGCFCRNIDLFHLEKKYLEFLFNSQSIYLLQRISSEMHLPLLKR